MHKGAVISECGLYRYWLTRRWEKHGPTVLFVGLNPSTADAETDDPTVRRWISFAQEWGFAGMCVVNLFAYRATDRHRLRCVHDPVGPRNNTWISSAANKASKIVVCWGKDGRLLDSDVWVRALLSEHKLWCYGTNADGTPKHPLYLKKDTQLVRYG